MSMTGIYQVKVDTTNLADGHSIAAYLTSAAGVLITSETIGANEHVHSKGPESHIDGSAYVPTVDYLSSIGVVDDAGNWVPFTLNAAGELPVAATVNFAGDYPEDSPHVSGDIGLFSLAVRRDVRSSGVDTDGDYASFNMNAVGELWVKDADVLARLVLINNDTTAILADTATIDSQTLSIQNTLLALSKAEDAPHASGDQGIQALAVRNDTEGSLVSANGDYASLQLDALGRLRVFASFGGQYAEDSAAVSGDLGTFSLAVRRDAQASTVSASGDYSEFQTWSEGSLKVVDIANGTILQSQVSVTDTAAQVPAANLANRKSLMLQNTGANKLWIGSATVTTTGATSGIELPANSFLELEVGPAVNVFAVKNGAAGNNLNVLQLA